jgi:hypothetical protein
MAELKLIDNLIDSPDTSILPMASCGGLATESEGPGFKQRLDRLPAISDGVTRVECGHTNFNSHTQIRQYPFLSLGTLDTPLRNREGFDETQF